MVRAQKVMLKSNFHLVGGQFVGCCIAAQNFRKLLESTPFPNVAKNSIFKKKLALRMLKKILEILHSNITPNQGRS